MIKKIKEKIKELKTYEYNFFNNNVQLLNTYRTRRTSKKK